MKIRITQDCQRSPGQVNRSRLRTVARSLRAFSLIELCVAMAVILVTYLTIFACMTMGLWITQASRENLRATQIMLDKMEGIRLYTWDQLNNPAYLVPAFTNWFYETNNVGLSTATGNGVQYNGTVTVTNVPMSTPYSDSMRKVTVTVNWTSKGMNHIRAMATFCSQLGMQNYTYNN